MVSCTHFILYIIHNKYSLLELVRKCTFAKNNKMLNVLYLFILQKKNTHQSSLTYKVDRIKFYHWFEQSNSLPQPSSSTSNSKGHCGTITHMWIIGLCQERHNGRTLFRRTSKEKKEQ